MKTLLMLSGLLLSVTQAQANIGLALGTVVKSECYIQASNQKDFAKTTGQLNARDYIVGGVRDSLLGELDPRALGDGGLLNVETTKGNYLIYEAGEEAPLTSAISEQAEKGLRIIAIKKACLTAVTKRTQRDEMQNLGRRHLKAKGPYTYFQFL